MKPIDITNETFDQEVKNSDLPVVVDFWAEWCPPCKALGPALNDLAKTYDGKVKAVKVDAEAAPELAQRFRVTALPTICVFMGGKMIAQEVGFSGKKKLKEIFEMAALMAGLS